MIFDATGLVMGRLASITAKCLLQGEEIRIVNAEKAIISGSKESVLREYREMLERGTREKGPYFPKRPDRILKRTVRGMLPYKTSRGREAMARLRVYVGVPPDLSGMAFEQPDKAKVKRTASYMELGELSRTLGSKF